MLLFDDNKIQMIRKPGKIRKKKPVACTGEGKRLEGNIREGSGESKTGTVLELSLKYRLQNATLLKLDSCFLQIWKEYYIVRIILF